MYECTFPKDRTDREYRRFLRATMLQFASHILISGVTDLILLLFWRWERETRIASGPDSLVLAQGSVSMGLFSYDLVTAESQPSHQQTSHPGKATMNSSSHWKVSLDVTSSNTFHWNCFRECYPAHWQSYVWLSGLKREHICSQNMKNLVFKMKMQSALSWHTETHRLLQLSCSPAVCLRWTCSSLSSLSCSSRSTPPETSRASVWPTTTSSVTCSPSPSSSWSRYQSYWSNHVATSSTAKINLLFLKKTVCSPLSSGVSLSERDPRAVSQLLLSGQSDGGVAGRERNCSAGHPGQGEPLLMFLLMSLMM